MNWTTYNELIEHLYLAIKMLLCCASMLTHMLQPQTCLSVSHCPVNITVDAALSQVND